MKNTQLKVVAGILAASFMAVTSPAKAGPEAAALVGQTGLDKAAASLIGQVRKFLKEQKKRIKEGQTVSQCPEGTHPSQEGEMGTVCRSNTPASVTCEISGWQRGPGGEGAPEWVPVIGKCTPEGGWAGKGPSDSGPQAP